MMLCNGEWYMLLAILAARREVVRPVGFAPSRFTGGLGAVHFDRRVSGGVNHSDSEQSETSEELSDISRAEKLGKRDFLGISYLCGLVRASDIGSCDCTKRSGRVWSR